MFLVVARDFNIYFLGRTYRIHQVLPHELYIFDPSTFLIFISFMKTCILILGLLSFLSLMCFVCLIYLPLTKPRKGIYITTGLCSLLTSAPGYILTDLINLLYSFFLRIMSIWFLTVCSSRSAGETQEFKK